jgi:hypothetical protein
MKRISTILLSLSLMIPGTSLIGVAVGSSILATTVLVVSSPSANAGSTNCYNNAFGYSCSGSGGTTNCYDNAFGTSCSGPSGTTNCYNNAFGTSCSGPSGTTNCYDNAFGTSCSGKSGTTNCYNNAFGVSCSGTGTGLIPYTAPTPTPSYKTYPTYPIPVPTYKNYPTYPTYPTPVLTPSYSSGTKTTKEMVDEFQALLDKVNSDTEELNNELNSVIRLTCKKGSKTKYVINMDPECPKGYKQTKKSII